MGFSDEDRILMKNVYVFTALHGMLMKILSVRLAVCLTRAV